VHAAILACEQRRSRRGDPDLRARDARRVRAAVPWP